MSLVLWYWRLLNHCSARVARNSAQAELRSTPRTLEAKSRNYYTLWVGVIPSIKCLETLVEWACIQMIIFHQIAVESGYSLRRTGRREKNGGWRVTQLAFWTGWRVTQAWVARNSAWVASNSAWVASNSAQVAPTQPSDLVILENLQLSRNDIFVW